MDCATYTTEAAAEAGALRNWINYIKEQVALGEQAKVAGGDVVETLDGLTDNEIGVLQLCGNRKGQFLNDNGSTVAFVRPVKAYETNLWYYIKPADKYMTGVEDCVIQEFDPVWESPEGA